MNNKKFIRLPDIEKDLFNTEEKVWFFWCPGCNQTHFIDTSKWKFDEVQMTATPSLLIRGGNKEGETRCHSFVKNGQIQFLNDCTHKLKGQTVDVPDYPGDEYVQI